MAKSRTRTGLRRHRRGVALMLVMVAVIVAGTVAYSYLGSQSTSIGIARNIRNSSKAQYVADSGMELALAAIRGNTNWRTDRPNGAWITNQSLAGGTVTISGEDGFDRNSDGTISIPTEGDGDLADDSSEAFTLTVTGKANGSAHITRAVITPSFQGMIVLFVVGNPSSLSAGESGRKALMESWKYGVTLVDDGSSQPAFDSAVAAADVVYVSNQATAVGTKLKSATAGLVNEDTANSSNYGVASTSGNFTDNRIEIVNSSNYITQNYPLGTLGISSASLPMYCPSGTMAAGAVTLGQQVGTTSKPLVYIESGGALYGGGNAVSRRVASPLGGYAVSQLNTNGTDLIKRSLEWASGMAGVAAFGFQNIFAASQDNVENQQIATQVTLAEAGTLMSITAYVKGPSGQKVRYAIYSNSSGQPGSLLTQSASANFASNSFKWQKLNVPATVLGAGTYWLAMSFNHKNGEYRFNDGAGQIRYNNTNAVSSGFSNSWGSSSSSSTRQVDIYGTYAPTAGGAVTNLGGYTIEDTGVDWLN